MLELVARIRIETKVLRVKVSLKEAVVLEQVVVIVGHERPQNRRRDLAVIHRPERLADVME